jgi:hypothetical protein
MTIKNLALILAMVISIPALSQDLKGKNMAKVNLSSFALKGFNLQYERRLTDRVTVELGYANIPTSKLPYSSFIQKQINDPGVNVADFRLGASVITPGFRFYVGSKGAFHGFYLAPYARFGRYSISGPVNYTAATEGTRTAIFDGKLHTTTGGLMIGSSFQLASQLYLDWWIIGASIGGGNGDLRATTPLTPDEQASLQRVLNDLDVPLTRIQTAVNNTGATITTTGTMIGVRGLGINIGFRF